MNYIKPFLQYTKYPKYIFMSLVLLFSLYYINNHFKLIEGLSSSYNSQEYLESLQQIKNDLIQYEKNCKEKVNATLKSQ